MAPESKKLLWLCFVILTALAVPAAEAQMKPMPRVNDGADKIELSVGEQRVMPAHGVKTYSEGVHGIVDIRLTSDATRFVIVGLRKGTTTLLLIMVDGTERVVTIHVYDPNDPGQTGLQGPGVDPFAVEPQASIRLDLYFVQVSRSSGLDYGVTYPQTLASGNLAAQFSIPASALITKTAVVGTEFLPRLDAAQSRGYAKINRHIAVITANGTQANFDSGGDFNTVGGGLTPAVVSIKYGTNLSIQPRYDHKTGRIEMTVNASVADLTPSAGSPLPGRTSSTMSTIANLALGESLAVAGLITKSQEKSSVGLPFLSRIPVLGLLFGKQTDREAEQENLVFIAPSVVVPLQHARAKEFLSRAIREFDGYAGEEGPRGIFPGTPRALPMPPRRAPSAP